MNFFKNISTKLKKTFRFSTQNAQLIEENAQLKLLIEMQAKEISLLKSENIEFRNQLKFLSVKKDSHNSSKSPSSDIVKKNKSLRTKSNRKTGGQKGHIGHNLLLTENPDIVIDLIPKYCNKCGSKLNEVKRELKSKRQVVDIPPVVAHFTEYRKYQIACKCGHYQSENYPLGITNNIQYGENIQAIISYLSIYQYLPYKRLKELLRDLFSINLSQGTIQNILNKMSKKASVVYDDIRNKLEEAEEIGSDETGARVNGQKNWVWVWQNKLMTFISLESSRGQKVIDEIFPNGFPNAIIGTDRWAAQLNTYAKGHQLCFAHLLRDLNYLIELEKTDFASKLKKLFLKAILLKKEKLQYTPNDGIVIQVEREFDTLLKKELSTDDYPKTQTFRKAMLKHRNSIFTFLYYSKVEADNNSSERAIRNIKVKQKISGQFKTGGQAFCVLRSIIDTAIKSKIDIFNILKLTAANNYAAV